MSTTMLQDLRFGLRVLLAKPGFTVAAALAVIVPARRALLVDPMQALRQQ